MKQRVEALEATQRKLNSDYATRAARDAQLAPVTAVEAGVPLRLHRIGRAHVSHVLSAFKPLDELRLQLLHPHREARAFRDETQGSARGIMSQHGHELQHERDRGGARQSLYVEFVRLPHLLEDPLEEDVRQAETLAEIFSLRRPFDPHVGLARLSHPAERAEVIQKPSISDLVSGKAALRGRFIPRRMSAWRVSVISFSSSFRNGATMLRRSSSSSAAGFIAQECVRVRKS